MNRGHSKTCKYCKNKQSAEWQFCKKCKENMYDPISIGIISPPGWVSMQKSYLKKHGSIRDPKGEQKFQDYIEVVKKKELASSESARRWEDGRKKEWKKNKPYYIKNGGKF